MHTITGRGGAPLMIWSPSAAVKLGMFAFTTHETQQSTSDATATVHRQLRLAEGHTWGADR